MMDPDQAVKLINELIDEGLEAEPAMDVFEKTFSVLLVDVFFDLSTPNPTKLSFIGKLIPTNESGGLVLYGYQGFSPDEF